MNDGEYLWWGAGYFDALACCKWFSCLGVMCHAGVLFTAFGDVEMGWSRGGV